MDNAFLKEKHQKILVNLLVSGGRDSMALLHAVSSVFYSKKIHSKCQFVPIVTHFNHKKRGKESDEDAFFVGNACLELGIEFFCFEISPNKNEGNFQNFARTERQRLSIELCTRLSKNGYSDFFILTAHHAQDHVESVLMHLIRGSGSVGMEGFYGENLTHFIKPFAEVSSEEIQEYIEIKNIKFRTDSSNLTDDYNRNFLRHHVLPKLSVINSNYEKNILRFSKQMKEFNDLIDFHKKDNEEAKETKKEFVFLPTTTATELYFYLKPNVSENSLNNILHEVDLFRKSCESNAKSIPLKNKKTLKLYKIENEKNKIFSVI